MNNTLNITAAALITRGDTRRAKTGKILLAILLAAAGGSLLAQPATPPAPPSASKDDEVVSLQAFVSTGTRFNDRTVVDSPVPIDVVSRTELTRTGSPELSQQLQAQVPSFNFPRPSLTDGTDHIRPATLRGLAPDQVLVLVNGKRRHTSALVNLNGSIGRGSVSTDFNAIPSDAIERVEILRDGASAQYGSDAIAGVINVLLRKDVGWGTDISYGETKQGDGDDYKINAFAGVSLGGKGSLFTNIWAHDHEATNRIEPDTRQQYLGSGGTVAISGNYGSGVGLSAPNGTLDPREATINRMNHRYGDPRSNDQGIWFNGDYPLTESLDLYFFGGGSRKHANSAGFFRRPGDDRTVRALYPDGFLPYIQTLVDDRSIGGGAKGKVADWTWDLSSVYGANSLEYRTAQSANVTYGAAGGTSFYDGRLKFGQLTNNLDLTNAYQLGLPNPLKVALGAEYRREEYTIGAGELLSYANGGLPIQDGPNAGALAAVGAQVFPGFKPSDAGAHRRDAKAGYVDLEQEIGRVLLSAAGRFEDYSDFGNNTTGKIAGRLKILDSLALRGSLSSGFRAPHLAQEWFSSTATNFINGVAVENLTLPVSTPAARALGATALKPEKSLNEGAGLTWNPAPEFSASVDFYHIKIKDRIVLSSNFSDAGTRAFLAAQGITGVGAARYFTNAVDTKTEGVDLSARYALKTADWGRFTFTAGYNHNTTKATKIKQAPAALAAQTTIPLFDLTETIRLEKGQPKDAANASVVWDFKKWSFLVRETRFGEVSTVAFTSTTQAVIDALTPGYDVSFAPAVPGTVGGTTTNKQVIQTFGAKFLTDLDVGYKVTKNIRVSVGANNLFDVYPDQNIRSKVVNGVAFSGSDNVGIFPYNSISPFGFTGAYYYVKASFHY
jgi:iron complex outermembrane receptor protein